MNSSHLDHLCFVLLCVSVKKIIVALFWYSSQLYRYHWLKKTEYLVGHSLEIEDDSNKRKGTQETGSIKFSTYWYLLVLTKHISKLLKVRDLSFSCSCCTFRRKLPGVVLITLCLNGKFTLQFFIFSILKNLIQTWFTLTLLWFLRFGKRKLQKIQWECETIQAKYF